MYRFFTRRASLIYCDRLFSQYKASHLSEASCLIGPNELDTAKMTVIRMKLLIALGHRIISVHVSPKKPPMEFVLLSFSLFFLKQRCLIFMFVPCSNSIKTFAASNLNTQGLNNSCLKSPASTLVDLTFQSRALRSFSLNQLRNLSL